MRGDGKQVKNFDDLDWWGFDALTGEACGLGIRVLVDMGPKACDIMERFLATTIQRGNGWNDTRPDHASMMLPTSILRQLAVFCLLDEGHSVVVDVKFRGKGYWSDFVEGMTEEEWGEMEYRANLLWPGGYRIYRKHGDVVGGTRNFHKVAMRSQ